jgi:hypothetical protein
LTALFLPAHEHGLETVGLHVFGEVLGHVIGNLRDALVVVQQRIEPCALGRQLVRSSSGRWPNSRWKATSSLVPCSCQSVTRGCQWMGLTTPSRRASVTV